MIEMAYRMFSTMNTDCIRARRRVPRQQMKPCVITIAQYTALPRSNFIYTSTWGRGLQDLGVRSGEFVSWTNAGCCHYLYCTSPIYGSDGGDRPNSIRILYSINIVSLKVKATDNQRAMPRSFDSVVRKASASSNITKMHSQCWWQQCTKSVQITPPDVGAPEASSAILAPIVRMNRLQTAHWIDGFSGRHSCQS